MRWMEYSTFTPIFRAHGRSSFLHNPWGWTMFNSIDEIPLELSPGMKHDAPPKADVLPDKRVEPLCKKYINLRYSLMPYIYNLSHEAYEGKPIMRPLWCYYPEDHKAIETDSEYFFGRSLLVAPVTAKSVTEWDVYLPDGIWYDYWTKSEYSGNKVVTIDAPLDRIPLFVPAGGVLIKTPVVQYISSEPKDDFDPITVEIYDGADALYDLYEDDGISLGYQCGEYSKTHIKWDSKNKVISIMGESGIFPGRTRNIEAIILPEGLKKQVKVTYKEFML